ncbi:MAG TPA: hypothetical protein VLF40_00365 [Candidatus Saccharimonadales bacterium]|nr:hypothetical protein [Candidatus Saccharimonadales bacterium]
MAKPVIAVDIDNVLSLTGASFIAFSNQMFGTSLTLADYSEDWQTMWGVPAEEIDRRAQVMIDQHMRLGYEPVPHVLESLTKLREQYTLVALTSRKKMLEPETRPWVEQHCPGMFQDIVFAGFWDDPTVANSHTLTKGELYTKLGARYAIDDQPKHCQAAAAVGVDAILFGDYPWNQADELPSGVTRCNDWAAVLEYFDGQR